MLTFQMTGGILFDMRPVTNAVCSGIFFPPDLWLYSTVQINTVSHSICTAGTSTRLYIVSSHSRALSVMAPLTVAGCHAGGDHLKTNLPPPPSHPPTRPLCFGPTTQTVINRTQWEVWTLTSWEPVETESWGPEPLRSQTLGRWWDGQLVYEALSFWGIIGLMLVTKFNYNQSFC